MVSCALCNSAVSCRPTEAMCPVRWLKLSLLNKGPGWHVKILTKFLLIWTISRSGSAAQTAVPSQQGHRSEWELLDQSPAGRALGGTSNCPLLGAAPGVAPGPWAFTSVCVVTVTAGPDLTARSLFTWKIWFFPGECKMQRWRQFSK